MWLVGITALDGDRPGANQVGEALALLAVEYGVDAAERANHGVAEAFRGFDAQVSGLRRLGAVERVLAECVGEGARGTAVVHRRLGAFRLQVIEDLCELGDLRLLQLELPCEEAKGPAYPEGATAEVVVVTAMTAGPVAVAVTS